MNKNMTAKESFECGKIKLVNSGRKAVDTASYTAGCAVGIVAITGIVATSTVVSAVGIAGDIATGTAMMTVVPAAIGAKNVLKKGTSKFKKENKGNLALVTF